MVIAYDSKTGNVKRFVQKLGMKSVQIEEALRLDEPFILVTYTTGFGQAPDKVLRFLRQNHRHLLAVSASGNKNWGASYAKSADAIARLYGVPVLCKFELSGTPEDVNFFKERMHQYAAHRVEQ